MENTTKLLINHFVCHVMVVFGLIYGTWWMFLLGFLWWQVIAIVGISSGYHRYFSHRSFHTHPSYALIVHVLGLFSGAGPALTWAAAHRQHHAFPDKEGDPHSVKLIGAFKVYMNTWGYGFKIQRKYVKALLKDKLMVFFYRHYFKLSIAVALVLLLIDPMLMIFGYAFPVVLAYHGYGLLNTLGHRGGEPSNSFIANILTGGEGWHKNHHERPGDWEIGKKWYQFDPASWFIRKIKVEK